MQSNHSSDYCNYNRMKIYLSPTQQHNCNSKHLKTTTTTKGTGKERQADIERAGKTKKDSSNWDLIIDSSSPAAQE